MGKKLKAFWELPSHPVVSTISNVYTLLPLLLAVGGLVVLALGRVLNEPALFVAGIVLALLAISLGFFVYLRSRKPRERRAPAHHRSPADDPPEREPTAQPKRRPPRPRVAQKSLDDLYVEGKRMLEASGFMTRMTGASILYGAPATEADIDRWQGKVRAALPPAHRRRFRFAPLQAKARTPLVSAFGVSKGLESEKEKRLRESLEELERIMDEIG